MRKRPHILLTNDDGIQAKGIKHLWQALRTIADVTVVAPSTEQSSMGMAITIRQPLMVNSVLWDASEDSIWAVTGTPADCVKMALAAVLKTKPDLIVSGINRGSNIGRNVLYSGTVGAAIEGVMQEIPSIAFSCQDYKTEPDYALAGQYTPPFVDYILSHPLPKGTLLNVNFPSKECGPFKGFKMACQGTNHWMENPDKREHPAEGHHYYWLGSKLKEGKSSDESDDYWIKQGYITAVPIHVGDLTDWRHLNEAKNHFENKLSSLL